MKLFHSSLILMFALPLAAQQTPEEEIVRNAYAKITVLASLDPVSNIAVQQRNGENIDTTTLDSKIAEVTPTYTLTKFRVGPVDEILNKKWIDLVSQPTQGLVLEGAPSGQVLDDNGYRSAWTTFRLDWTHGPDWSDAAAKMADAITVTDAIKLGHQNWEDDAVAKPVTYTRYAAFIVDATLQGKSSGPHKALFLFGTDAKGKPAIVQEDLITGSQLLWYVLKTPYDPSGLLLSKVRETSAARDWINNNLMPASSCSSTSTHDLCCSKGRCGISPVDFNRDMSVSIPSKGVRP